MTTRHSPIPEVVVCSDVAWITLTRGKRAVVDAADVDLVRGVRWHYHVSDYGTGYAYGYVGGVSTPLHRHLTGWPRVDHINHNGLDNRRKNLREATHRQNMANMGNRRLGASGFRGVYARKNRWRAELGHRLLGYFLTAEDAARAYDDAALAEYGEFAVTNEALGLLPPPEGPRA